MRQQNMKYLYCIKPRHVTWMIEVALMKKRKSISYYIVWFCVTLIIGSSLFALIWQPSFEHGVISIKIMDSYVGYNLWGFLTSLLLLLAFVYFFIKSFRSSTKLKSVTIAALLSGVLFIFLLGQITYGWTSYPPLSSLGQSQLTRERYNLLVLSIQGILIIAMIFLLFRWYREKDNADNTSLPK